MTISKRAGRWNIMQRSKGKGRASPAGDKDMMELTTEDVRDICRRMMSMDRNDYLSLLDEYCDDDILLNTDDLHVRGRSRIISILDFTTTICKASGVIGEPLWSSEDRTIGYDYYRHLKFGGRIEQKTILHLVPAVQTPRKWRIAVIGDPKLNLRLSSLPIIGPIYLAIWRPIFTHFLLLLALVTRASSRASHAAVDTGQKRTI